ncbi:MAG: GNAT family N-acetyltransferase [Oscillospiraceae bacterium]|nr:GNAT family N-acetyltransferase [Oscillospiraceae bacterium]
MKILKFDTLESVDFQKLMEIYVEGNAENISYFFPDETDHLAGLHKVERKFYDYLKTGFFNKRGSSYYVLEDGGNWVSAIRLFPVEGQKNTFFAEALETAPKYRRKGYARKMISLLYDKLKEDGDFEITDTVNKHNTVSVNLHLSCGFEVYKDPAVCVLNGQVDKNAYTMRYKSEKADKTQK